MIIEGEDTELQWELRDSQGTLLNQGSNERVDMEPYSPGVYLMIINGEGYKVIKQ